MKEVAINKVFGEVPVNVKLFKNDDKITKMEVNNRKFSSEKMGRTFIVSKDGLGLTDAQVEEIMSAEGEVKDVETAPSTKGAGAKGKGSGTTTPKTDKKNVEPVEFTQKFRSGKALVTVTVAEGVKDGKKTFTGSVVTSKTVDAKTEEVKVEFATKDAAIEALIKLGISKTTGAKMIKAGSDLAVKAEDLTAIEQTLSKGEELEDVGILGEKKATTPKEPRKPVDGYPKWVMRDPQDVNQYKLMQEAKNAGYSAKVMEANRDTRGSVAVVFEEDLLWHVNVSMVEAFSTSEDSKDLKARLEELAGGKKELNTALMSTEKRYALFLARALSGTYKLAFDEKKDVKNADSKDLTSKDRRQSVYNRG
jgi:hypothetical protein